MLQAAAIARNPRRQQQVVTRTVPAPVGGWNDRDALAAMDPADAVILKNMFPLPSKVMMRKGYTAHVTGLPAAPETVMGYRPATGTAKLFAAASAAFYDCTSAAALVTNYALFPGASGDYIHTPDSVAFNVTDLDIRAYVQATDWTPAAVQTIAAKSTDTGPQRSFRLFLDTTGKLGLLTSVDGTATISTLSTVATGFTDATAHWVRATVDVDNGAAGNTVTFYTAAASDTPPTSWTILGAAVVNATATSIFDSTALFEIGAHTGGTLLRFIGKIWQVLVYSGIAGTLKAHFNANDGAAAKTTNTSAVTAEVYTVAGAASIVGPKVQVLLTNARWSHVNIATSGGNFLMAVNGADKLRGWSGTAWWTDGDGAHDITGVDTATCISACLFKRRVWLIVKNSTSVWYLPVDSIAGAAAQLDFGSIFQRGGYLMAMANWSLDAGIGIDDYAAFISDQGECAVYKGSDPTSAATWALVGVFLIGAPIGRRCTASLAGDVMLITRDGLLPLSKALMSSRVNSQIAISDKISNAMGDAATLYGANYGWQAIQFAPESMVLLNVPTSATLAEQYVMNSTTGAWCRFSGWNARCFETYGDELYFGGAGGSTYAVFKAWSGYSDYGTNIFPEALQAFNYFGSRSMLKEFTLAQPLFATDAATAMRYGINVDFDQTAPTGVPTVTPGAAGTALWNTSLWDVGVWSGYPEMQKAWQSVGGIGYCAGMHMAGASNTGTLEWYATTYAFKPGGVL